MNRSTPVLFMPSAQLMNRHADFHRATILLKRAVVLRPNDPVRHVDLGESYRNFGEYRRAIGCCQTALRLRPEYPEALNTLGLAFRGAGDPEFARLASLLRGRLPDDGLEVIERLLADPQLGPQPRRGSCSPLATSSTPAARMPAPPFA